MSPGKKLLVYGLVSSALTQAGWLARSVALDSEYRWSHHMAEWAFNRLVVMGVLGGVAVLVGLAWMDLERSRG